MAEKYLRVRVVREQAAVLLLIDGRRSVLSPMPIRGFTLISVKNHPQEGKKCGN
jgi:hypothetical protein